MTRWAFTFSCFALAGWSVAQCPFPTGGLEGQITWHAAYSVEFNPEYRIAEWVNYEVTAAEIQGGRFDGTDDFRPDPPPKYVRLTPRGEVRLRAAYLVTCTGFESDAELVMFSPQADHGPVLDHLNAKMTGG